MDDQRIALTKAGLRRSLLHRILDQFLADVVDAVDSPKKNFY